MPKLRVIVGQGTAAEVFRSTLSKADGYDTIVIGPKGLWAALPSSHKMGQTPALLNLPGQPVPVHSVASGRTPGGMAKFMDVNTYQTMLIELSKRNDMKGKMRMVGNDIALDQLKVTKITERQAGGQLLVATSREDVVFLADQVVLATGVGPQRTIPEQSIVGKPDETLGFTQILEGVDYLNQKPDCMRGTRVAIYGGSATAAWVAKKANADYEHFMWFTRPGGSEFTGCTLPGDRNADVLEETKDKRRLAKLIKVEYMPALSSHPAGIRKKPLRAMLKLHLEEDGVRKVCKVDQLIHSIGSDASGAGGLQSLLSQNIQQSLQPLVDSNRVLGDGKGVLAIGSPSSNILIVGAGTYNLGKLGVNAKSAPMGELPTAAQVPDGIAVIVATESALNNFIPFEQDMANGQVTESNLNINLADRNQLAVYLALFHPDLSEVSTESIVAEIIRKRSGQDHAFGVSEKDFHEIIEKYDKAAF